MQDQPTFQYDSTGKITGYKTKAGADTVFPFKSYKSYSQSETFSTVGDHTITFNNLSEIVGITNFRSSSWEHTANPGRRPIVVSGNTVSFRTEDIYNDGLTPKTTITITVNGIPK